MSITTAIRTAREDAEHRPDITDLLAQLGVTVAAIRQQMRINCPPGLHVDAVADSRLDLVARFAAEIGTAHERGTVYTGHDTDEVEVPERPQMYAVTADDLRRIEAAGFVRGWDGGYAAAGDEAIEVAE